MEIKDYLKNSEKTLSTKFYYDEKISEPEVFIALQHFMGAGKNLDIIKKRKFYGKNVESPFDIKDEKFFNGIVYKRDYNEAEKLLHAAIGIGTESSEIIEAVFKAKYQDKQLDVVNIEEELGDLMWYIAILLREYDIDFHKLLQKNIDKLKARYGEKFSEEKANNRDLKTERNILEK